MSLELFVVVDKRNSQPKNGMVRKVIDVLITYHQLGIPLKEADFSIHPVDVRFQLFKRGLVKRDQALIFFTEEEKKLLGEALSKSWSVNAAARKLQNPRLNRITFHTFRHWKATMEYHRTKDILHVMKVLGHYDIRTTWIYTQLMKFEEQEYMLRLQAP